MVIKHAMYEILSNSAPWVLLPFHEMLKPLNNQRGGDEVNVSDAHYSAAFGDSLVEDLCGTQDFNGAGNRSIPLEPVLLLPAPPASTELTASIDHVPIAVTLTCLVIALICFIRMFCWLWGIILSMILRYDLACICHHVRQYFLFSAKPMFILFTTHVSNAGIHIALNFWSSLINKKTEYYIFRIGLQQHSDKTSASEHRHT